MSIQIYFFKSPDTEIGHLRIANFSKLTSTEADLLRSEVHELCESCFEKIYLDTRDVNAADLAGINEVIHSNYLLQSVNKKLILIYRKNSVVEKWIGVTGLDRFVQTALLPAC